LKHRFERLFFIYNIIFCLLELNLVHAFRGFPSCLPSWKHRKKRHDAAWCETQWLFVLTAQTPTPTRPPHASVYISISRTLAHSFIVIWCHSLTNYTMMHSLYLTLSPSAFFTSTLTHKI
jgi:hypothetical protein